MFMFQDVPQLVETGDTATTIIANLPVFINTFLIFWNIRQSKKNQERLKKVEGKLTNGGSEDSTKLFR